MKGVENTGVGAGEKKGTETGGTAGAAIHSLDHTNQSEGQVPKYSELNPNRASLPFRQTRLLTLQLG